MPKPKRQKSSGRRRLKRVSVRADHRDQPDWDRFAWALLQHTKTLKKPKLPPKRRKGEAAP
jgi:hypothetical protein